MTVLKNPNPLYELQREKSGASTYDKYMYQYNWALYRIIKEHEKQKDYAVFIELHEDVVLADSLDSKKAKFEFNQIKTNATKISLKNLTDIKKGKQNSILGKLLDGCLNKGFSNDYFGSLNRENCRRTSSKKERVSYSCGKWKVSSS